MDFRTFDHRNQVSVHRRMQSSYSVKRNNNYSVVIDSKIVTKSEIINLKAKFDEKCKNGWCQLKDAILLVKALGYCVDKTIDTESCLLVTFNNLLEILFKNANKNQINRLLKFAGIKVVEDRVQDLDKSVKVKNVMDHKEFLVFKNIFDRYDLNKDGKVDLKELKNLLKDSLGEESIEEMYVRYTHDLQGLTLNEFIRMHAPEDLEIPDQDT